jgi:hypothetical protein
MRIAVVGSRDHGDEESVGHLLARLIDGHTFDQRFSFVTGDQRRGVDAFVRDWCLKRGVPCSVHEANWSAEGKAAGPIRNGRVIHDADEVHVCFWQRNSKGSSDAASRALHAGKPLHTYYHGRIE